eukprot:365043-Chlamydomonas_euryale.AAC.16
MSPTCARQSTVLPVCSAARILRPPRPDGTTGLPWMARAPPSRSCTDGRPAWCPAALCLVCCLTSVAPSAFVLCASVWSARRLRWRRLRNVDLCLWYRAYTVLHSVSICGALAGGLLVWPGGHLSTPTIYMWLHGVVFVILMNVRPHTRSTVCLACMHAQRLVCCPHSHASTHICCAGWSHPPGVFAAWLAYPCVFVC